MKLNELLSKKNKTEEFVKVNKFLVGIKTSLNAKEFLEFVNIVVESSFDENGEYNASFKAIVYKYAIIKYFTDIELDDVDANTLYDYSNQDWFDSVISNIPTAILAEIDTAIAEQIEYKIKTRTTAFDRLCDNLIDVVNNISEHLDNDTLESIKTLTNKMNAMKTEEVISVVVNNAVN